MTVYDPVFEYGRFHTLILPQLPLYQTSYKYPCNLNRIFWILRGS